MCTECVLFQFNYADHEKGTWDLSELSCLSYVWGPTGLNNANIGLQTSQKSDICTYTASV